MLQILPCGNPGSLEHTIASLAKNGIDTISGRFFFEEPGHLRRLNTRQMDSIAFRYMFRQSKVYYGYHFWETIVGASASRNSFLK